MPKEIDLTIIKQGSKILVQGIYSFGKDQLVMAASASREMNVRPKVFDVIGGDNDVRVFILERKKEKK